MAAISLLAASGAWAQGFVSRTGIATGARAVLAGLAASTWKAESVPLAIMGADNIDGVNSCRVSKLLQYWGDRQGSAAGVGMIMLSSGGYTYLLTQRLYQMNVL